MFPAKVYVPQVPAKFDAATRLWVPTVNLRSAEKFGAIVECLPAGAGRLHLAQLVIALRERMDGISADDWIVAVGDPSLIAAAAVIMFKRTGALRLLKWDRMEKQYIAAEVPV
jgi:hypothetical protein